LLSQLRVDGAGRICLTEKALRTADHFLLCRYFDYQQVSYHKTVAGLEMVLKDVLSLLLERNVFDCSPSGVAGMIANGTWHSFDDGHVIEAMRRLPIDELTEPQRLKIAAILERRPPKLLWSQEWLGAREDQSGTPRQPNAYALSLRVARDGIARGAQHFRLDP